MNHRLKSAAYTLLFILLMMVVYLFLAKFNQKPVDNVTNSEAFLSKVQSLVRLPLNVENIRAVINTDLKNDREGVKNRYVPVEEIPLMDNLIFKAVPGPGGSVTKNLSFESTYGLEIKKSTVDAIFKTSSVVINKVPAEIDRTREVSYTIEPIEDNNSVVFTYDKAPLNDDSILESVRIVKVDHLENVSNTDMVRLFFNIVLQYRKGESTFMKSTYRIVVDGNEILDKTFYDNDGNHEVLAPVEIQVPKGLHDISIFLPESNLKKKSSVDVKEDSVIKLYYGINVDGESIITEQIPYRNWQEAK